MRSKFFYFACVLFVVFFWLPNLWIQIGRMDVCHFCAIGEDPHRIPQKFPTPLPYFFTMGQKVQNFDTFVFGAPSFELEDFFANLKNLSRADDGRTTRYQPGGVGPPALRTVCHYYDQKWTPKCKMVKSLSRSSIVQFH